METRELREELESSGSPTTFRPFGNQNTFGPVVQAVCETTGQESLAASANREFLLSLLPLCGSSIRIFNFCLTTLGTGTLSLEKKVSITSGGAFLFIAASLPVCLLLPSLC